MEKSECTPPPPPPSNHHTFNTRLLTQADNSGGLMPGIQCQFFTFNIKSTKKYQESGKKIYKMVNIFASVLLRKLCNTFKVTVSVDF